MRGAREAENAENRKKFKKWHIFAIFEKFQKHVIYIGIGYLNANFHEVTFKNGDFSGKSVFFRIFENLNLLRSRFCKKFTHLIYISSFVSKDFLTGPVLIKS